MSKICLINLTTNEIQTEPYDLKAFKYHGRSLAVKLIEKYTDYNTDRLDEENIIVLAPGLFTGTQAPSTGRMTVATRNGASSGIQIINMTGSMAQRLASLSYSAVVIRGKATSKNTVIYMDSDTVKITEEPQLNSVMTDKIIAKLRDKYGEKASVMGTGPAADSLMPLATLFSTYPNGMPSYYCTRNGFGDVWGSKNLKAIVVNCDKYFAAECFDRESFNRESKRLAKLIVNNPICGQALPGYGSITLIKLLKSKENISFDKPQTVKITATHTKRTVKLNRTCTPLCVIGCLNRHCDDESKMFSAPAESEVSAALINCFSMDDSIFAKKINTKAFLLGIDSVEFVFTVSLYFKAIDINPTQDDIYNLLIEIENNTTLGRIIASKTNGVYELYKYKQELNALVTKPVINEEGNFKISIDSISDEFKGLSNMELLYNQIFILENLGFCIFTSFALINNQEALKLLADMFYYKTGVPMTVDGLIRFAKECIDNELEYQKKSSISSVKPRIPEFTKVLYRYFS